MIVSKEEMKNTRLKLVHKMHEYILNTGDETIYETWMEVGIPDAPTEEDFEWFTDPYEFKYLCTVFGKLVYRNEEEDYQNVF